MAIGETIFQHWVVTQFILPFLLIWTITFAILQKTKLLGDSKKQLDSIVAFVIGLIFVGAIFPKLVVGNLILFLTVSIIVVFVALMLWGFIAGEKGLELENAPKALKWVIGIAVVIAVIIAVVWASGVQGSVTNFLFYSAWSSDFWINGFFILAVVIALAAVLRGGKS